MSKKFQVLCLHGHGQTADGFRTKTGAIRGSLKGSCEFHYLEGPFVVPPCAHSAEAANSWVANDFSDDDQEKNSHYIGLDQSITLLGKTIIDLEIDAIIGFSLAAGLLVTWLSKPSEIQSRIRFVGLFSAFIPNRDEGLADAVRKGYMMSGIEDSDENSDKSSSFLRALPTFHCYGESDEIIVPERSQEVVDIFRKVSGNENVTVFTHPGGHLVPSQARKSFTDAVKAAIART